MAETKWTYGAAGTAFETARGQVWKVGRHTFVCSDLMEDTLYGEYLDQIPPTLLYCDPPWGNALLNGFRTKAGMPKATYDVTNLYERISNMAVSRGIPLYLEGSKPTSKDGADIPGTMRPDVYPHQWGWEVSYSKKNSPSGLYYAGLSPVPSVLRTSLTGVNDMELPLLVMQQYPVGVVADPCGGRGNTSRKAELAGWSSVLNEMNVYRLSAALARAEKAGMGKPVRIA